MEIDIHTLKQKIDAKESIVIIDCRQIEEREFGIISKDTHLPLHELESRYAEIPKDKMIIVYCRSGHRSLYACSFLRRQGYEQVFNLKGGILAWRKIDPSITPY